MPSITYLFGHLTGRPARKTTQPEPILSHKGNLFYWFVNFLSRQPSGQATGHRPGTHANLQGEVRAGRMGRFEMEMHRVPGAGGSVLLRAYV
jgi:hypothetical protein